MLENYLKCELLSAVVCRKVLEVVSTKSVDPGQTAPTGAV